MINLEMDNPKNSPNKSHMAGLLDETKKKII